VEQALRPFWLALDWFLADLFQARLPADWRRQWHGFVAQQTAQGRPPEPQCVQEMEEWIEAWARFCDLLPLAEMPVAQPSPLSQGTAGPAIGPQPVRATAFQRAAPHHPTQQEIIERFFNEKLEEAQRHLNEIHRALAALGTRLDMAKLREQVEVEAEAESIESWIWQYNDALESARDEWLRKNLSGDANERMLKLPTPLSFGLPLYTDELQAERAQRQTLQISKRLYGRNVTMDRVVLAAQTVEVAADVAGLAIGGGVLLKIAKKGGKWAVAKALASTAAGMVVEEGAQRGATAAGVNEQALRGIQLAAAVVKFILLRRGSGLGATSPHARITPESQGHVPGEKPEAPATSSKPGTGLVPTATVTLGQWGEIRLKQVLGGRGFKPRAPLRTSLGKRYVDLMLDRIAHEAKAGINVGLDSRIREQALKDAELIAKDRIKGAHWHFFQGAQRDLLDFLSHLGIQYTVH
jgi:hypothetical protein